MKEKYILAGFLAVALAIGVAEWLTPASGDDNVIVVTPELREFVQTQVASAGKVGGGLGMDADKALDLAIEEEMLYREAMRLGLDQDDLIVKRRVVQKMRFLLEASTPLEEPTEAQLQAWLASHPDQFLLDGSLAFEHIFFARRADLATAMDEANRALETLHTNNALPSALPQGDPHVFNQLNGPVSFRTLAKEVGTPLAEQWMKLPLNQWSAPLPSGLGVHIVKISERTPAKQMSIAEAGLPLKAAVKEAQRERMNEAALAAIASRYKIERLPEPETLPSKAKP